MIPGLAPKTIHKNHIDIRIINIEVFERYRCDNEKEKYTYNIGATFYSMFRRAAFQLYWAYQSQDIIF